MIVKIMTCQAMDRGAFHQAQRSWASLVDVQGFIAQLGGWDTARPDHVLLIAIWQDTHSYDTFMGHEHDQIHNSSAQAQTYKNLVTVLTDPIDVEQFCTDTVRKAGHIRMADCRVHAERLPHFLDVQRAIWNPGMSDAGALAVWPLRDQLNSKHICVASLWPSTEVHTHYRQGSFYPLREQAQPDADLASMNGWSVTLESEWAVF